ncbi:3'-5' exonuclease family protein [Pedobacter caeni]|uniref:Uncharacterized protein n=1 Tax=Pedobacter caeni TaxID=288992 RepID=A0A1M4VEF5_9SPHI|nr:hypothetical protein [Pedobacter caeni]SHE67210.1 hypothetical protein SAMN04488522_101878 [Pedobacter caeni]
MLNRNKQKIVYAFLAITFLLNGCKKEEKKPDKVSARRSVQALVLNGNNVNTLEELHEYVRRNGFTDDINGTAVKMYAGDLNKSLGQLISDKTPVVPREAAFNAAVENAAYAYARSIFNPNQAEMDFFQKTLQLIGSNAGGQSPYMIYKKADFDIETDPTKPDFGLSKYDKAQILYFDTQFKMYDLYRTYLNQVTSMTDEQRIQKLTNSYIPIFKPLVANNYKGFDAPFSIGEILPWLRNNTIGTSRNAFCLNLAPRIQDSNFTAAVISDILTTNDGKWVGVLLNVATDGVLGSSVYMYVGDTRAGDILPYHWDSEKSNKSPWEIQPDYSVVKPKWLAEGPPVIKKDPRDLNP